VAAPAGEHPARHQLGDLQGPLDVQVDEVARLLDLSFDDRTASWWLKSDGEWARHHLDADGEPLRELQEMLIATKRRRRRTTERATLGTASPIASCSPCAK
jgi:hypothetical protein